MNDWAISPELTGKAQNVSFYARSLWDYDGGESFEFLYSTEGTDIGSFQLIERVDGVPGSWTYYSYDLPEGAKYFAIRCVSYYQYMFMVDDVTFTPAGGVPEDIEHIGYNVYRDDENINSSIITGVSHVDTPSGKSNYTYAVTAVYNYGESVPTNRVLVSVESDGVETVITDLVNIVTQDGTIIVSGAEGQDVNVYDIAGHVISETRGNSMIAVAPGCYLVQVGSATTKVIVR